MKPSWEQLGATTAPDGTDVRLMRRDAEYLLLAGGKPLMSSQLHGSEEALATLGCAEARQLARPRVLVGGLGMGFTLRAVLDVLPATATVTVAELVPAVIAWNRDPLAALARYPLRDPRVRIQAADVGFTLRAHAGHFDAILLDVDNGPAAFTALANAGLYDDSGVAAAYGALCPRGTLAVWSAFEDADFEERLRDHGFAVEVIRAHARGKNGARHAVFVARKGGGTG
jgi:spermidine synthase